ncbi:hypothetical protein B0W47_09200 [Komagataeibacter nataicola]|uniref:Uncharacterized protein n=1 Tax=Komagataeibacter nataicola TaxID=265960 RepID=A0A9N7CHJ9_9PROT|nr:hypothetical protein B0W47_09200 [Komagataeibacter nataicola]
MKGDTQADRVARQDCYLCQKWTDPVQFLTRPAPLAGQVVLHGQGTKKDRASHGATLSVER